ncbi:MAG: cell division protein FtsQ/DivIB [Thermodesulfobacteriota bacterium]
MSVAVSRYKRGGSRSVSNTRTRARKRSMCFALPGLLLPGVKFILALIIVVGFSILILFGYREITTSSYFMLKNIEVSGNNHLQYSQVLDAAGVQLKDNLMNLNISGIKSELKKNPWISSVVVTREFPDKLSLQIAERQACFWIKKENRLYYVDKSGKIIDSVIPQGFISLPLAIGDFDEAGLEMSELVSCFQNGRMPFSLQQLAWIDFLDAGTAVLAMRDKNLRVELDIENLPGSAQRLGLAWNDLLSRNELDEAGYLCATDGLVWVKFKKRTE